MRPLPGEEFSAAFRKAVPLGMPPVDMALPWGGLPVGGVHEILAAAAGGTGDDGAALAFAAFAAGRFQQVSGSAGRGVIWCRPGRRRQEGGLPYGAGLWAWGLDPRRVVLVEVRRQQDLFWALEEALRDGSTAAVIGEGEGGQAGMPDIALRRLQLAAERSGLPALLLRPAGGAGKTCPSLTRWLVRSCLPEDKANQAAPWGWRLDLLRCRGGRPQSWTLGWAPEPRATPAGRAMSARNMGISRHPGG